MVHQTNESEKKKERVEATFSMTKVQNQTMQDLTTIHRIGSNKIKHYKRKSNKNIHCKCKSNPTHAHSKPKQKVT